MADKKQTPLHTSKLPLVRPEQINPPKIKTRIMVYSGPLNLIGMPMSGEGAPQ